MAPPKVAIVADAMVVQGGAERVVEALAEAFPSAPIYTLLYDPTRAPSSIRDRVITSWLQRFPGATRYGKALLPLYPLAFESFDLSAYDIIVSSSHTLAKGVLRTADQVHVCYCHTPMRSIWERTHAEVRGTPRLLHPLLRSLFMNLRQWDFMTASRVDQFIANSRITQKRIGTHYRRDSIVVTPPIETHRFRPGGSVEDYYLVVSRNVPYKRIDLAIAAAERLGRHLIVVGEGTTRLTSTSGFVSLRGNVSQEELLSLMQGARALLSPQLEDFGMAMLEMNACGRPVIAFAGGGALETLVEGKTGIFFHEQNVDALANAILRFESLRFDSLAIRRHAERFSKEHFIATMRDLVLDYYRSKQPTSPPAATIAPFILSGSEASCV